MATTVIKHYLGDGLFLELQGDTIVLTTENGVETTNTVVMEPEVLDRFLEIMTNYADEWAKRKRK